MRFRAIQRTFLAAAVVVMLTPHPARATIIDIINWYVMNNLECPVYVSAWTEKGTGTHPTLVESSPGVRQDFYEYSSGNTFDFVEVVFAMPNAVPKSTTMPLARAMVPSIGARGYTYLIVVDESGVKVYHSKEIDPEKLVAASSFISGDYIPKECK